MKNIVEAHGSGQLSSGPACAAAAYVAAAVAPAAETACETMSASRNPSNPSSPIFSSSTSPFTTICSTTSPCASSCCSSGNSYTAMSWTDHDAEVTNRHDKGKDIKDGGVHDDSGIEDRKKIEMQPLRPVVLTTLSTVDKEVRSMHSTTEFSPSAALPSSPFASIVSIADSRSESNLQRHADASSVPVSQVCPHFNLSPPLP